MQEPDQGDQRSAISYGNPDTSAALRERPFPADRQAESWFVADPEPVEGL